MTLPASRGRVLNGSPAVKAGPLVAVSADAAPFTEPTRADTELVAVLAGIMATVVCKERWVATPVLEPSGRRKPGILDPGPGIPISVLLFYGFRTNTWDSRPCPRDPGSSIPFLLDSLGEPGILDPGPGIRTPVLLLYWTPTQTWDSRRRPGDADSCTAFLLDSYQNQGFPTLICLYSSSSSYMLS